MSGDKVICFICVRSRCKVFRIKRKMIEDEKLFSIMKKMEDFIVEFLFWVGKLFFRSWKRFVLE